MELHQIHFLAKVTKIENFVKTFSYFILHYTFNGKGLPYPTRSANDPPPIKEAVGESGHPLNDHFIGHNLIPPLEIGFVNAA